MKLNSETIIVKSHLRYYFKTLKSKTYNELPERKVESMSNL